MELFKEKSINKKIILLYPYFNGISGAYNRYLLLEKLIKRSNIKVKLIILEDKTHNSTFTRNIYKLKKFLKVELLILYYSIFKNNYFITDFNPSIIALFSKKVFIQIHDVSWENKDFARHSNFFYTIFKFFLKYYSNILTVSKTSMLSINKISGREKRIFFLYNSVNENYIKQSNNISIHKDCCESSINLQSIDFSLPNILYIATLTPRKCHFELLEALSQTDVLFNVNLVGYPSDKKTFDLIKNNRTLSGNFIKSNINYFPELSQKELCNLLICSSAYISTSLNEGFGIPILEAQVYKVPLIIRDININRELFPKAKFFKSTPQLVNLLNDIVNIKKFEIEERKKSVSKINEDNLGDKFNYSNLSNKLKKIILNKDFY